MKNIFIALRLLFYFTLLTGIIYPLCITGMAKRFFANSAQGSLIEYKGKMIGSALIGQNFKTPKYFWPRPSAIDYNPLPSGGSNLGPTSKELQNQVQQRKNQGLAFDLLSTSASGLDPHISPEAAFFQIDRIAQARNLKESSVAELRRIVSSHIEKRQFGFLGEPRVNVLLLNLAVDEKFLDHRL